MYKSKKKNVHVCICVCLHVHILQFRIISDCIPAGKNWSQVHHGNRVWNLQPLCLSCKHMYNTVSILIT